MLIQFLPPALLLIVCNLSPSSSATTNYHLLQCRRGYYTSDKVTAVRLGYCWKFWNYNATSDVAFAQCKRWHARLPAVNTAGKARKLSKFIAASIKLYSSGEMGSHYRRVYENGWPGGNEFWLSDIVNGYWNSTNVPVSSSLGEQPIARKHGKQCVLFNYLKSTWRYTGCGIVGIRHPFICEEKEHVYADEVGADDMTTPSLTMSPTPAPQQGATFTCPKSYDVFENYCFYLSSKPLSITDAEKTCQDMGGRQAWISESTKEAVIKRYVKANVKRLPKTFGAVWFSRLEGNGYIFKWKSSGTNARYLLNKYGSYFPHLMTGVEPKMYLRTTGRVYRCRDRCMNYQALCEADGIWKGGKAHGGNVHQKQIPVVTTASPNAVAPPGKAKPRGESDDSEYEEDDDEYDNDDSSPEDETFDPNNILTRGPKYDENLPPEDENFDPNNFLTRGPK